MKSYPILLLAFISALIGCASNEERNETTLTDFQQFFSHDASISSNEVIQRFGKPTRFDPLLLGETPDDATLEHSWWYYELSEGELIGIQVDEAMVRGVFRFYQDAEEENEMETIRPDPAISNDRSEPDGAGQPDNPPVKL